MALLSIFDTALLTILWYLELLANAAGVLPLSKASSAALSVSHSALALTASALLKIPTSAPSRLVVLPILLVPRPSYPLALANPLWRSAFLSALAMSLSRDSFALRLSTELPHLLVLLQFASLSLSACA